MKFWIRHRCWAPHLACSRSVLFPSSVTAVQPGSRVRSSSASSSAAARNERRSHTEYTTVNASPHRRCSARQPRFWMGTYLLVNGYPSNDDSGYIFFLFYNDNNPKVRAPWEWATAKWNNNIVYILWILWMYILLYENFYLFCMLCSPVTRSNSNSTSMSNSNAKFEPKRYAQVSVSVTVVSRPDHRVCHHLPPPICGGTTTTSIIS